MLGMQKAAEFFPEPTFVQNAWNQRQGGETKCESREILRDNS